MKAILVIDTPRTCGSCLAYAEYGDGDYCECRAKEKQLIGSGIPDWCPLKPIPQFTPDEFNKSFAEDYFSFEEGWETCIEKILGEENE